MANMCMNLLKVDGPEADVAQFAKAVASGDCSFDFNKAVPMPSKFEIPADASRAYPEGMSQEEITKRLFALGTTRRIDPRDRLEPLNCDEWRTMNWGPNAPPADVRGKSWTTGICFETRWCPPERLIDNLAARFPKLRFALSYFEPLDGFAGRAYWESGKRAKEDETKDREDPFFAQVYAEDFGGDVAELDPDAGRAITFSVGVDNGKEQGVVGIIKMNLDEDGKPTSVCGEYPALAAVRAKAQRGDAEAQLQLAICCLEGQGVHPADPEQGMKWLRKAVDQGLARAKSTLAVWNLLNGGAAPECIDIIKEAGDAWAQWVVRLLEASGFPEKTGAPAKTAGTGTAAFEGDDGQTAAIIRLQFQRPDPDKAVELALRAFLVMQVALAEALELVEDAIRLDQINALNFYHPLRAMLCQGLGKENPRKALDLYNAAYLLTQGHHFDEAEAAYKEAANLDPVFLWPLNNLAWMRATQADPMARAGKKAVRYAKEACVRSNWNCGAFINTLAAAYAEVGDFEQAVDCQLACLALVPEPHRVDCEEGLASFRAGKALVDRGIAPANEAPK